MTTTIKSNSISNSKAFKTNHTIIEYEKLLDEFWVMRELHPDQFKGALLNRLRDFSKLSPNYSEPKKE